MIHELNNLLQALYANLEGLRMAAGDHPELKRRIDISFNCVQRMAGLIATLKDDDTPAAAAPAAVKPAEIAERRLRIVVAEDDALVRMTVAGLLEEMGHSVTEASSGEEALRALAGGADVLVTDLNLPDMLGDLLAATAKATLPKLVVVIATGEERDAASGHVWLQKPFSSARLRAAVKDATATL